MYTSKGQRKNLPLQLFKSKCSEKKGGQRLASQAGICLKFSQAEGILRQSWSVVKTNYLIQLRKTGLPDVRDLANQLSLSLSLSS